MIHCWGNAVFDILFIAGLFDTAEHHFGSRPDIFLTTAGIIDEKDWQKCLDIDVVRREWKYRTSIDGFYLPVNECTRFSGATCG